MVETNQINSQQQTTSIKTGIKMLETHKVNFQGIAEIKEQIKLIQSLLGQTYEEINKLSNMGITIGIEHGKEED